MGRSYLLCCTVILMLACSSKEAPAAVVLLETWRLPAPPSGGKEVVATVDGVPITVDEVAARARAGHLTPEQALEQLIDDRLVLAHALANQDPQDLSDAFKAAAVHHLIQTHFEPSSTPETISDETLRGIYDEIQVREFSDQQFANKKFFFSHGQWRATIQLVVTAQDLPDAEAAATAESLLRLTRDHFQLQIEQGHDAFRESAWHPHRSYVPVRFENLPPLALDDEENFYRFGGEFDKDFLRRIFELPAVGAITNVFPTRHGLHWVFLSTIIPERRSSFEEVREELRNSIGDSHRSQRFEEWLTSLRRDHHALTRAGRR